MTRETADPARGTISSSQMCAAISAPPPSTRAMIHRWVVDGLLRPQVGGGRGSYYVFPTSELRVFVALYRYARLGKSRQEDLHAIATAARSLVERRESRHRQKQILTVELTEHVAVQIDVTIKEGPT